MLVACSNCEAKHRPHHMCQACGFYNGRLVIDMQAKTAKRDARMNAKKEAIAGQQAEAADAQENEGEALPAPEQTGNMADNNAAALEKKAKSANAATAAQVTPKPQSSK